MNRITESSRILAENLIASIMKDYDACSLAACIIDHTGTVQYEIFRGEREKGTGKEINGDTIFGLASVTKSFTALAVMQMAEAGILSVDDPVSKYIPEFTNRNTDTVRISHLLSHAGGFFPLPRILVDQVAEQLGLHEETDGDLAYNEALAIEGGRLVAQRLDEQTMEHGLNGRPGEHLSYCNDGFGLLSEIIRRYGGYPSFAEYLNEKILKPMDMERSFIDFVRPSKDENAAMLYEKKDGVMTGHRDYHDNAFVLNGGGAMKSTLNDLKKYLAMYLNKGIALNGTEILSDDGVREMLKGRMPYGYDGTYGYGLYTQTIGGMRVPQHGGSLPGVSSNIAFTYDNDCAVIVLSNTSGVPVAVISDALLKMYAGVSPLNSRDVYEHPWSDELIDEVCGTYSSGEGTAFELYRKPDGTIGMKDETGEKSLITTGPETAVVRNLYSDIYCHVIRSRQRGVYAVQYGSRLIPKE
ncbi:MAG: beta-lactamase family protein [Solobacterium sp.]|nr:beta-lactamase family protein [Solobacterium sp.]